MILAKNVIADVGNILQGYVYVYSGVLRNYI